MKNKFRNQIATLEKGSLHPFSSWPNKNIPDVVAGLYSVWLNEEFIYIGMSGRGLSQKEIQEKINNGHKKKALYSRLNSHASGRRSGDQFCLYICDRFVIPKLDNVEINKIGNGELSLDKMTREFIHNNLKYRFALVESGAEALALESYIKTEGLAGKQPFLNPS